MVNSNKIYIMEENMWTRAELKDKAKEVFASCRWPAVAVSLIYAMLNGGSSGGNGFSGNNANTKYSFDKFIHNIDPVIILVILGAIGVALVVGTIISVFVKNPIEVGVRRFFMISRERQADFREIAYGFKNNFLDNVLTLFLRDLFIFLWSLLFVIPGIIKGLEYSMIPYILAENPDIDRKTAFELSKEMTDGQKWDIFVMGLSFIPWYLLAGITCGLVGIFYAFPYINCTYAELYATLRDDLINKDPKAAMELNGFN